MAHRDPTEDDPALLREQVLCAVESQLRANDPPETRATLEMFEIVRHGQPHDPARYAAALAALPGPPE